MWIFAALIGVPLIEIGLFIEVGGLIGLWPTLAVVVATAVAGAWLLRRQGLAAVGRLQAELERGGDPSGPLAHGAMILFAGALLLTPGFFTDAVGFTLLIPKARDAIIAWAGPRMAARVVRVRPTARPAPGDDQPIETEYRDVTPARDVRPARGDDDR